VVVAPGRILEGATIVVRGEKVESVGVGISVPADARVLDFPEQTIYPGFLDAYTEQEAAAPPDTESGAAYWHREVRPEMRVDEVAFRAPELEAQLRSQGFTARLVAPRFGIIKGTSAVVTLDEGFAEAMVVVPRAALHVRLTVPMAKGRGGYPNSPMGAVALARQAFHDAQWYRRAWQAVRVDPSLPLPERNRALEVLSEWVERSGLVIADTSNEQFCLRADRWAREFGLRLALRGSGREYRLVDAIAKTGRPLLVPLAFPPAPNVATREVARTVRLESLLHWDLAPENPARLERAGIRFALTTDRLADKEEFLPALRKAVSRGLSPEAALRALTLEPARLLGVAEQIGSLERGKLANFFVTDGDVFAPTSKVLETWVRGKRYPVETRPVRQVTGGWDVRLDGGEGKPQWLQLRIEKVGDTFSGSIERPAPAGDEAPEAVSLRRLGVAGARVGGTFDAEFLGMAGVARFSAVVEGEESLVALGRIDWTDGTHSSFAARRDVSEVPQEEGSREETAAVPDASGRSREPDRTQVAPQVLSEVAYPLGASGRVGLPQQPEQVILRGATIWTSGPQGRLDSASLVLGGGKILAVGRDVEAAPGAVEIDATGWHLTPGIIDCHSHMGTDGGINESGQAITAEVRIGDFIDASDITIYRQLAGGVTCANILHGSANPIGGQNQVIKLRWGGDRRRPEVCRSPGRNQIRSRRERQAEQLGGRIHGTLSADPYGGGAVIP